MCVCVWVGGWPFSRSGHGDRSIGRCSCLRIMHAGSEATAQGQDCFVMYNQATVKMKIRIVVSSFADVGHGRLLAGEAVTHA